MVCAALGLCQTEQAALAKLRATEQLTSNNIPQVDLAQPVAPFILNVPQLLYPQDTSKQQAPQQETPKTVQVSSSRPRMATSRSHSDSDRSSSLPARQGSDDVCQDCIKFLTDAQAEAKANSSFVDSLIENIENQCDLLGPAMSSLVRAQTGQRTLSCSFVTLTFPSCVLTAVQGVRQPVQQRHRRPAHVHGERSDPRAQCALWFVCANHLHAEDSHFYFLSLILPFNS